MPRSNQNPSPNPGLTRFHTKRLRNVFLQIVAPLKCRPEPRDAWDDLGRADADLRSAWMDKDVTMIRAALLQAEKEGTGELAASMSRAERYFAEKMAMCFEGLGAIAATEFSALLVDATEENSDVIVSAARCQQDPSEGNLEQLRLETIEANTVNDRVLGAASLRLVEHRESARAISR